MPLGAQASAPQAFVDFCRRQPSECGVDAMGPDAVAQAESRSNQQVWRAAFAAAPAARAGRAAEGWDRPTASIQPAGRAIETSATVDWARLFAEAKSTTAREPAVTAALPVLQQGVELTPKLWSTLGKVNARLNRAISNRSDIAAYGVEDFWTMPLSQGQSFGDCEDFVLEKRAALISSGVATEALSIAVVEAAGGQAHAVLVVTTSKGDYVLDNLTPWILPWDKTSYRWQARQVSGLDAFTWAAVRPAELGSAL